MVWAGLNWSRRLTSGGNTEVRRRIEVNLSPISYKSNEDISAKYVIDHL